MNGADCTAYTDSQPAHRKRPMLTPCLPAQNDPSRAAGRLLRGLLLTRRSR